MAEFNIKSFLSTLTNHPGIYQMLDAKGDVLYVGKARNLQKRVSSYFQKPAQDAKTMALLGQVCDMTVTVTSSENEALLLEINLIKKLKPRYNILLKDDKSYPYLFLSDHPDFPRLDIHRGAHKAKGRYFGPFPSAWSVRETLTLLQKLFKIRQCSDHFFSLRARPCLQYFIQRCTAPCVAYVDVAEYQENVRCAVLFLEGKNAEVIETFAKKMEQSSAALDYEAAARYRDQIVNLRRTQEQQAISSDKGDVDVLAAIENSGVIAIQLLSVRGGRLLGGKAYFPRVPANSELEEVLTAFLPQFYLDAARGDVIPSRVILNLKLKEKNWIAAALFEKLGKKIILSDQARGLERKWLEMALTNARHALSSHIVGRANFYQRFEELQMVLHLATLPQRVECFDVSHISGESTVASCVVFDTEGPIKRDYRRFNIKGITKSDDYAGLTQALQRHFIRLKKGEGQFPDLLLIDGGKGQLKIAENVLEELQVSGITLMAVAKGPSRKPGMEKLFISGRNEEIHLPPDSAALHLIQQIRDEAHRFAIVGHRKLRAKTQSQSILETIPGIGAKRRRELLRQFGGLQEIKRASIEELAKVPGINLELAQRIFQEFHGKV